MNSAATNKLHAIYPIAGTSCQNNLASRREAVIINRLKIGHSRLTHSYLLSGEDQPICTSCDALLTVKHILTFCFLIFLYFCGFKYFFVLFCFFLSEVRGVSQLSLFPSVCKLWRAQQLFYRTAMLIDLIKGQTQSHKPGVRFQHL